MTKPFWEESYARMKNLWGIEPDAKLYQYKDMVIPGKILDLGIGEGRNSLFFAEKGFHVEGVDISETALNRCKEISRINQYKMILYNLDFRDFKILNNRYSLIIAANVLNFMKRSEVFELFSNMKSGLVDGGLIYIGAFSTMDPKYMESKHVLPEEENDTFYFENLHSHVYFFSKDEFLELFKDFETIYYSEGIELDLGHGDPHYHGVFEYIGRKTGGKDVQII